MLQPSRAIERKNVPGAVRLAAHLDRMLADRPLHLWISGPAEDGYADTLERIVDRSTVPVTIGRAPLRRRRVRGVRPRRVPVRRGKDSATQ